MKIQLAGLAFTFMAAGQLRADETLVKALEFYRKGNCQDAKPLLEQVLARQPKNESVKKLLTMCVTPPPKKPAESARAARKGGRGAKPSPLGAKPGEAANVPAAGPIAAPVAQRAPLTERDLAGPAFGEAEMLIKAHRYQSAEKLLVPVVTEKPRLVQPRLRLAEIYSATGRFKDAAGQYKILSILPDAQPEYTLRVAQNLMWAKDLPGATEAFRSHLDRRANDQEALAGLANVLFWQNRLEESIPAYQKHLAVKPSDNEARQNLAKALMWTGKYAEALPEFLAVQKAAKSKDPVLQLAIAQCYEQMEKPEEALAAFERAVKEKPGQKEAVEGRDRLAKLVLLRKAYELQEKGEYKAASKEFLGYLERNPNADEVLLQVARLHSWGQDTQKAITYYEAYLTKKADDVNARRELAKIQMSVPDFEAARRSYSAIIESGSPVPADYEGMVNAHLWEGHYDALLPFLEQLNRLDPESEVARNANSVISTKLRAQELDRARLLASTGKFSDSLQAYRKFVQTYGADREIELAMARLLAWDGQAAKSIQAYQEYLHRYGQDHSARLELADLERWNGKPKEAGIEYNEVLKADPASTQAKFGLAQISDQRGDDRFLVYNSYRNILGMDPAHRASRERLGDIAPRVSPAVRYHQLNFRDSDQFSRSINSLEAMFPLRGGLRISPLVRYGYFNQFRQVGGGNCDAGPQDKLQGASIRQISETICTSKGNMKGLGGGVRLDLAPKESVLFSLEAASMQLDRVTLNRWTPMISAELVVSPKPRTRMVLAFRHRDAIYDVNTLSTLVAGITSTTMEASFEVPLNDRWNIWVSGGGARFSRGRITGFEDNTQRRVTARANYQITEYITAGYYVRASGFRRFSPLYFSPEFYGTTGVSWTWDKPLSKTFRLVGDLEMGYGRINRYDTGAVGNMEISLYPAFVWDVRQDLSLRLGYRFGRGRSSAFGSPSYTTGNLDLGLTNYFMPVMPRSNPSRIEIR